MGWLLAVALVALTVWAYADVAACGFLRFDDDLFVTGNPFVRQGLTPRALRWAFEADLVYQSPHADYWIPLTAISRMLDVELFGLDAAAHHLVNLLLHCVNVLLLFAVLRSLTGALWRSACVAAVLAVHPLHVEAVAWVTARKDVLSGLFWLATLAAYGAWARAPGRKRWALVLFLFACGLMSKPMVATLPFALLLLDYWPLGRIGRGVALLREKWALFGLSAASVAATVVSNLHVSLIPRERLPLSARLSNALDAYVSYLSQAFWPAGLAVGYPHAQGEMSWLRFVVCVVVLGLITAIALIARKRRPYLLVGWLWFVGTLLPTSGLVQSGIQGRADRFVYLPLIGISLALVWACGEWVSHSARRRSIAAACAVAAVFLLAQTTRRQISYWKDDRTLFTHATAVLPGSAIAHNGLGAALGREGQLDQAEAEFRESLRIRPDSLLALRNLSALLAGRGRAEEALGLVDAALKRPGLSPDMMAELHFTLGWLESRRQRPQAAWAHFAAALRLDSRHWAALHNSGDLLVAQGRLAEAESYFAAAQRLNPDDVNVNNNLGLVLLLTGRPAAAVACLSEGARIDPRFALVRVSLGRALLAVGRADEGLAELRQAIAIEPENAEAHFQLAEALRARGLADEAANHYREAVRTNPADTQARSRLEEATR